MSLLVGMKNVDSSPRAEREEKVRKGANTRWERTVGLKETGRRHQLESEAGTS